MTSRERLTRLFQGKDIDRVPIWLLAPYHPIECYVDIYNLPCYKKIVEYIDQYCDTFDRRNFDRGFCFSSHPDIVINTTTSRENGNIIHKETVSYKDLIFTKYISRGTEKQTKVKYFVEDIENLKKILEIPYKPVEPNVQKFFKEKEELGNKGLMMVDIGDPLTVPYELMSAENFSMYSLTDYDKLLHFTDEMYKRVYDLYKYLLERNVGEVFFITGAEFAGPPLVSPDKFSELAVRYVKGIVDLIRSYGKYSIVHYHGNLYHVLDGMKEINPDGLHPIEAPPIGDCSITQAREKLGDMILIGNVQYDDLAHKEKKEIELIVKNVIEEGKSGRFILSPTAGPYEDNISDKMVENYLKFIESGIKYGKL